MKEQEVRDAINKFNTTDSSLPYTVVAYACGFPSGVYVYAAPEPPEPKEDIKWPEVYQPWVIQPMKPLPEDFVNPDFTIPTGKVEAPKVNKCELDELIDAILALKAGTVEIYKLKALACAVRERNQ